MTVTVKVTVTILQVFFYH